MAEPAHIHSHILTREEQESLCISALLFRARMAVLGLELSDISKWELKDGTVLFGIDKAGIHTVTVRGSREIHYHGMHYLDIPQLDISIRAPWAYIALTPGSAMIEHVACLRPIIIQAIKEKMERYIRGYCASP